MVNIAYNINTGKIKTINGKLCTTCCEAVVPEYANCDNCCFLNPAPANWNSQTSYALFDCVTYNGSTWYALQANTNHTPSTGAYWKAYTACDNDDWDSYDPFGGPGKTPLKYLISVKYSWTGGQYPQSDVAWSVVVNKCCPTPPFGLCAAQYFGYGYNNSFTKFEISGSETKVVVTPSPYGVDFLSCSANPCTIKGCCSASGTRLIGNDTISWTFEACWIPLVGDCEYWSSSINYKYGDCVTYNGKIYIYCSDLIESNHPPESDATEDCGTNYWRLA